MRAKRRARGYTAVEVLLAMTVLLISTAGVMSMQSAAIQGNVDARKIDIANSIARTWLDRLSDDATAWNSASSLTAAMTETYWLSGLRDIGKFQVPAMGVGSSPTMSPAFDIFGRDLLTAGDPTTVFCTEVKVDTMATDANSNPTVVRATVVVFWAKQLVGANAAPASPLCAVGSNYDPAAADSATSMGLYHMIFATESLRRAP